MEVRDGASRSKARFEKQGLLYILDGYHLLFWGSHLRRPIMGFNLLLNEMLGALRYGDLARLH